jgi:hypothetical protein
MSITKGGGVLLPRLFFTKKFFMQPTLVGTIIQQNFSGVQELAQKLGYPVPQNPQEGYNFFVALRDKTTQQDFARYVMSVHPNWQLFGKNICNTMLQNNSQSMQYQNACCGFVNADGSQNGNGQNGNGNSIMNQGGANGSMEIPQEVRQGFDFLSQRISEIANTRSQNQILQYGIVFVVGLVAGKVLFK